LEIEEITIVQMDRLELTLQKENQNIKPIREQNYGEIRLILDQTRPSPTYHYSFRIFYGGREVGILHYHHKFNSQLVEWDCAKDLLYTRDNKWYQVYKKICAVFDLKLNNIKYIEIALDSTVDLVNKMNILYEQSTDKENSAIGIYQKMGTGKIMKNDDGKQFLIKGKTSSLMIYEKTSYAEDFIHSFYHLNGFNNRNVYRMETRIRWSCLRQVINRKGYLISAETLLDGKNLLAIFVECARPKLTYKDTRQHYFDKNKNKKFPLISVLDFVNFEYAKLPVYNMEQKKSSELISGDENLIRKPYAEYLKNGNEHYLESIKHIVKANDISEESLLIYLSRFNKKNKHGQADRMIKAESIIRKWSHYNKRTIRYYLKNALFSARHRTSFRFFTLNGLMAILNPNILGYSG
jgi:hypothetical protein